MADNISNASQRSSRQIWTTLAGAAVALVIVATAPLYLDTYMTNVLIRALFLGVLALTVDLVWGYTGVLTFGQSAFFGIGAYACALVATHWGFGPGWFALALVIGIVAAAVTAWLVGLLSFYHGASPLYSSIMTLALPIVLVQIIFAGGRFTGSSSGLSGFPTYYWSIDAWFVIAGILLVAVATVAWLFVRSDYGRILVAIRENEDRCAYLGIPVSRIKIGLFVACGAIGAVAGFGYAAFTNVVAPELGGFLLGTESLIWVALGGRGTLLGPILGAIGIDVTSSYLSGSLPFLWKFIVGVVFVLVIILLPNGFASLVTGAWRRYRARSNPDGEGHHATSVRLVAAEGTGVRPTATSVAPIRIAALTCRYGSLTVLDGIEVEAREGQLLSIVGPNGAGKTTLMRCISNGTERTSGEVTVAGTEIGRRSPQKIVGLGVGRSFQNTSLFDSLTVGDCLRLARYRIDGASAFVRRQTVTLPEPALEILRATGLDQQLGLETRYLSHGMKRGLELAMVLATEPRVLLLDEPTAGLTKSERTAIGHVLTRLVEEYGLCVFLIEHDLDFVREISNRIVVLHQGKLLLDGSVEEVVSSDLVKAVYAGHNLETAA
ncbi:ABC transporter permease subunit [Aurantimonas coralicida]|uniref:branched-chain amino acid ABC transporter ATP-binding protein/permease n=1 Tax=Aurantimonas coralicida TaxID=182270 RepID=UPI0023A44989|nr:ATP-binding cassette domain-containing protein [Aurantimonas coralicida]MDE0923745.1 ATP-binding cassette domain-containing protein [Aurantimonas coralicida]